MLTLTSTTFRQACHTLAQTILDAGFHPTLLIGIATGGDYVAAEMQTILKAPHCISISLQRPTTKTKSRLLPSILKHLPRPINNLLRILESRLYALRDTLRPPTIPTVTLPRPTLDLLASLPPDATILIVDDAIDSGKTMSAIHRTLTHALTSKTSSSPQSPCLGRQPEVPPACPQIITASITVTRPAPLIRPTFTLHPSPTLIRFPWSLDA